MDKPPDKADRALRVLLINAHHEEDAMVRYDAAMLARTKLGRWWMAIVYEAYRASGTCDEESSNAIFGAGRLYRSQALEMGRSAIGSNRSLRLARLSLRAEVMRRSVIRPDDALCCDGFPERTRLTSPTGGFPH